MHAIKAACLYSAGLIATLSTTASVAGAQQQHSPIGAGSWIIGGTAGLSSRHDESSDQTSTSVYVSPSGMAFVRERLAFGGAVTLGYSSQSSSSFSTIGVGPSARYYFGDLAGETFPFIGASVMPQWQKAHQKTAINGFITPGDATNRVIAMDGSLGLTRLVATHVGLTGEAYYTHLDAKTDAGPIQTNRSSYDVGLRFGITVFVH